MPLAEIPNLMRALGFYPSEQEVANMVSEVKYSQYTQTGEVLETILDISPKDSGGGGGESREDVVLRIVAEAKQRANGLEPDEKVLDMLQQSTAQKLDAQSTALYGTARLWDDGIIDPRDTRKVLAYVLDICRQAEQRELNANTFGVARL